MLPPRAERTTLLVTMATLQMACRFHRHALVEFGPQAAGGRAPQFGNPAKLHGVVAVMPMIVALLQGGLAAAGTD